MPARNQLQAAVLILRRKATASRALPLLGGGFGALLGFFWIRDSYDLAFRAFLFLYPYLFLFLSQDLFRSEIDSGALENVLFAGGGFRDYLNWKFLLTAAAGLAAGLGAFAILAACGLVTGADDVTFTHLVRWLAGTAAGFYYLGIGGGLSFVFRAGSNVLVVVLGQVALGTAFFMSMTSRRAWVESLLSNDLRGTWGRLRFLGLTLLFPNAAVARPRIDLVAGLLLAGFGVFYLICRKIRTLELCQR